MIDNSKEYISCSAIHYDNEKHYPWQDIYGIKTGFVLCGFRHPVNMGVLPENPYMCDKDPERNPTVCKWNSSVGIYRSSIKTSQGFMTSLGRFVNRKEAAEIAYDHLNYNDEHNIHHICKTQEEAQLKIQYDKLIKNTKIESILKDGVLCGVDFISETKELILRYMDIYGTEENNIRLNLILTDEEIKEIVDNY